MSKNLTDLEVFLEKYNTLLTSLASSKIYLETAYKYQDFYGEWGMTSLRFITPFLWIFPLIASSLLTISFKRQKLTGSMQKCMISLMAFDVFFAVSTGVKDAVLNAQHGNYDYVEYRICFFLLIFIRFQTIIHGTSLWIKSLMLIHRVLIFLFPLTFRFLRMRLILIPLFFFHILVVVFYMASTHLIPIQSFATVQQFTPGMPFERIEACMIDPESEFFKGPYYRFEQVFSFITQIIYLTLLPICIHIVCTFLFIVLVRKEIKKLSYLTDMCSSQILKKVKYLIIIKVHICLGISFMLQETPIYFTLSYIYFSDGVTNLRDANSVFLNYMLLTFAIGKPIDLIIYASLSKKVKTELQKIVCCKNIGTQR